MGLKPLALSSLMCACSMPAFAASSFQQTCSDIAFAYFGNSPVIRAVCLRTDGTPNATSLTIRGVSNQNGTLTNSGGDSSFQRSCGNITIGVTPDSATLQAFCRTTGGSSRATSIPLDNISNQNGTLAQ